MQEIQFQAYPVLINIAIFFLLILYTYPSVYMNGAFAKQRYTPSVHYAVALILITLYSVFGYCDNDFYYYWRLYIDIKRTGFDEHMEPIYIWMIHNLSWEYFSWRLEVWGGAAILMLLTVRRLEINIRYATCFIALFYLIASFSYLRGSLGISIMFLGYSYITKPLKNKQFSFLLGVAIIAASYFFHRSMLVSIAMLAITLFKLRKSFVYISVALFPILTVAVERLIAYIVVADLDSFGEDMQIGSRMQGYAAGEAADYNTNGLIQNTIKLAPIVLSLIYIVRKVVFKNYKLPTHIYTLFIYWYWMTYVAFLFFSQETSKWLFERFMCMSYFPMAIVLAYYYSHNKQTHYSRILMLLALFFCVFRLSYVLYSRMRLEGLVL